MRNIRVSGSSPAIQIFELKVYKECFKINIDMQKLKFNYRKHVTRKITPTNKHKMQLAKRMSYKIFKPRLIRRYLEIK
ncbi:hypothetical protein D3C86_1350750 [compost metagenome]